MCKGGGSLLEYRWTTGSVADRCQATPAVQFFYEGSGCSGRLSQPLEGSGKLFIMVYDPRVTQRKPRTPTRAYHCTQHVCHVAGAATPPRDEGDTQHHACYRTLLRVRGPEQPGITARPTAQPTNAVPGGAVHPLCCTRPHTERTAHERTPSMPRWMCVSFSTKGASRTARARGVPNSARQLDVASKRTH